MDIYLINRFLMGGFNRVDRYLMDRFLMGEFNRVDRYMYLMGEFRYLMGGSTEWTGT
jgi:hypothetical protein